MDFQWTEDLIKSKLQQGTLNFNLDIHQQDVIGFLLRTTPTKISLKLIPDVFNSLESLDEAQFHKILAKEIKFLFKIIRPELDQVRLVIIKSSIFSNALSIISDLESETKIENNFIYNLLIYYKSMLTYLDSITFNEAFDTLEGNIAVSALNYDKNDLSIQQSVSFFQKEIILQAIANLSCLFNKKNIDNSTAIFYLVNLKYDHRQWINLVDIKQQDKNDNNILQYAAICGYRKFLYAYLQDPTNPIDAKTLNDRNKAGMNLAMLCAKFGYAPELWLIINNPSFDPNIKGPTDENYQKYMSTITKAYIKAAKSGRAASQYVTSMLSFSSKPTALLDLSPAALEKVPYTLS